VSPIRFVSAPPRVVTLWRLTSFLDSVDVRIRTRLYEVTVAVALFVYVVVFIVFLCVVS